MGSTSLVHSGREAAGTCAGMAAQARRRWHVCAGTAGKCPGTAGTCVGTVACGAVRRDSDVRKGMAGVGVGTAAMGMGTVGGCMGTGSGCTGTGAGCMGTGVGCMGTSGVGLGTGSGCMGMAGVHMGTAATGLGTGGGCMGTGSGCTGTGGGCMGTVGAWGEVLGARGRPQRAVAMPGLAGEEELPAPWGALLLPGVTLGDGGGSGRRAWSPLRAQGGGTRPGERWAEPVPRSSGTPRGLPSRFSFFPSQPCTLLLHPWFPGWLNCPMGWKMAPKRGSTSVCPPAPCHPVWVQAQPRATRPPRTAAPAKGAPAVVRGAGPPHRSPRDGD